MVKDINGSREAIEATYSVITSDHQDSPVVKYDTFSEMFLRQEILGCGEEPGEEPGDWIINLSRGFRLLGRYSCGGASSYQDATIGKLRRNMIVPADI